MPSQLKRFPICCLFHHIFSYSVFNVLIGGDEQIRTVDPLLARQVLSQLSYTPISQGSCGGPKWTRTTDLTIISRAL